MPALRVARNAAALAFDVDEETSLPYGWSVWAADEETGINPLLSGYPGTDSYRDPNAVECEDDIRWLYRDQDEHQLTCNYCGEQTRSRNLAAATRWFHTHTCSSGETDDLRLDDDLRYPAGYLAAAA